MRRRDLLKAAAAAVLTTGVAPRLGRGADREKTLVFVGVADLSILDPVVAGARPTRNAAYLVFAVTSFLKPTAWDTSQRSARRNRFAAFGIRISRLLKKYPVWL